MDGSSRSYELIVLALATAIFLGCLVGAPALLDDVDAANASIARRMHESGDWVTARLDGVPYLEKPPLHQWLMALSYLVFGVHDWAARLPLAFSAILLSWVTMRFGTWAFGARAGFYAGLAIATCAGLFLFTRILIADGILTLTTTVAMWSFARALDAEEAHPRRWALLLAVALGVGFLAKGLIALAAPIGAALFYLAWTRQMFSSQTWRRLHPLAGALVFLLISAPWLILATLRNPPYFDFALHSGPGQYRGFFWLFFINEHLLRFLNLRYPRDYDTVPPLYFWLLHLVWLFPWSVFLPAVARLDYRPVDRAGRARILAVCWVGFLLLFFLFSTTQEYYSMPVYPALALLLGCAMAGGSSPLGARASRPLFLFSVRFGRIVIAVLCATLTVAVLVLLCVVWHAPTPGDISTALTQNPDAYKLALGHMGDLTIRSFAYLRMPLALAAAAFLVGALGAAVFHDGRVFVALAVMMCLFAHAARFAMRTFEPYLSSRPLAQALLEKPRGGLIVYDEYYAFSSVFFYANRNGLLVNARINDLEYGSYAPTAPRVFIEDAELKKLWMGGNLYYLISSRQAVPRLEQLLGQSTLHTVAGRGGKVLFVNRADLS